MDVQSEQNRRTNLLELSEDILVFSCKFWGQQCRVSLPECSNSTSHFVRHVMNDEVEAFHKQETPCCHLSRMLLASWIHMGLASRHASTCCAAISAGRCADSLPQHETWRAPRACTRKRCGVVSCGFSCRACSVRTRIVGVITRRTCCCRRVATTGSHTAARHEKENRNVVWGAADFSAAS